MNSVQFLDGDAHNFFYKKIVQNELPQTEMKYFVATFKRLLEQIPEKMEMRCVRENFLSHCLLYMDAESVEERKVQLLSILKTMQICSDIFLHLNILKFFAFSKEMLSWIARNSGLDIHFDFENGEKVIFIDAFSDEMGKAVLNFCFYLDLISKIFLDFSINVERYELKVKQFMFLSCQSGDSENIDLLVRKGMNFDDANEEGRTPLMIASCLGNVALVEKLINLQVDINRKDTEGRTALIFASYVGNIQIVEKLILAGASVNEIDNENAGALVYACQSNFSEIVKKLICNDVNVNQVTEKGISSLSVTCEKGYTTIVQMLIEAGADVHQRDSEEMTLLMLASENGHVEIVKMLIAKGVDVHLKDIEGFTALVHACEHGYIDVVAHLIDSGAKVNEVSIMGYTPLMLACENGHEEVVKLLIHSRAEVNVVSRDGFTPLILVCGKHEGENIIQRKVNILKILLASKAKVDVKLADGYTPLMLASMYGYSEIVQILMEVGGALEEPNLQEKTPLMLACENNHPEVVKTLMDIGADVNQKNAYGETALMLACVDEQVSVSIVKILIENGALVDEKTLQGVTALMLASEYGNVEIVKLLIDAGADLNHGNAKGGSALMLACEYGCVEVVETLIEKGANVNQKDVEGTTPLMFSCLHEKNSVVDILVSKGAHINEKNVRGWTALTIACKAGKEMAVRILLKAQANVNEKSSIGWTAMMFAASEGHLKIVELLIAAKGKVDDQDDRGVTALMLAGQRKFSKIVETLLDAGANPALADKQGNTSFSFAFESFDFATTQVLMSRCRSKLIFSHLWNSAYYAVNYLHLLHMNLERSTNPLFVRMHRLKLVDLKLTEKALGIAQDHKTPSIFLKYTDEKLNSIALRDLLPLFDEIDFTSHQTLLQHNGMLLTSEELRKVLKGLIHKIEVCEPYVGVPKDHGERCLWYCSLEKNCKILLDLAKNAQDKHAAHAEILSLAISGLYCGAKWTFDVKQSIQVLLGRWEGLIKEETAEKAILGAIKNYKLGVLEQLTLKFSRPFQAGMQIHVYNYCLWIMRENGIFLAEDGIDFEDPFIKEISQLLRREDVENALTVYFSVGQFAKWARGLIIAPYTSKEPNYEYLGDLLDAMRAAAEEFVDLQEIEQLYRLEEKKLEYGISAAKQLVENRGDELEGEDRNDNSDVYRANLWLSDPQNYVQELRRLGANSASNELRAKKDECIENFLKSEKLFYEKDHGELNYTLSSLGVILLLKQLGFVDKQVS